MSEERNCRASRVLVDESRGLRKRELRLRKRDRNDGYSNRGASPISPE